MRWFKDLSIATKVFLAFSFSLAVIAVQVFQSEKSQRRDALALKTVYEGSLVPIQDLSDVLLQMMRYRFDTLAAVTRNDTVSAKAYLAKTDESAPALDKSWTKFCANVLTDQEKEHVGEFDRIWTSYLESTESGVHQAVERGDFKSGSEQFWKTEDIFRQARKHVLDLIAYQGDVAKQDNVSMLSESEKARRWTLTLTLLGVLLSISLVWLVSRVIRKDAEAILKAMDKAADGDLSQTVGSQSRDETGRIGARLDKMILVLRTIMGQIADATNRLGAASQELSATADQAASGSGRQREQTEQVATAVEEMSATILEVSDNANKAADAARKTATTAKDGTGVVKEAVHAMGNIARTVNESTVTVKALGSSSDQIGEIIGVIDDIADQTNLLALNAAIEAARAGEQGRGFAVVADEVRKLAERTTKATKEIATMIKKIQNDTGAAVHSMELGSAEVTSGVEKVNRTGEALSAIVTVADEVGGMITQIAAASTQQSSAAEEVSASITGIADIAKQTSMGAEQSARAANDLAQLAQELGGLVKRFTLSK